MYHLGQEEFLRQWNQEGRDLFVLGDDLGWVDLVCDEWETPSDWGGFYREGHRLEFRQIPRIREYMREIEERKARLEQDGEYIRAENEIQETYRQKKKRILKKLEEEAARQGFRVCLSQDEIQFEGAKDPACLCEMAAEFVGKIRQVQEEGEEKLRWFRTQLLEQIGSGVPDPFILACGKAWQYYDPQKSLWNRVEEGRLRPGQLLECGCLLVSLKDLMQDQKAYSYLKRVWKEKCLKDWWNGEYLVEQPLEGVVLDPIPYGGRILLYGSWEWRLLWRQTDPEWAEVFSELHWKSQCPCDRVHRKELREHLMPCSREEEKALISYMRRGAQPGQMWTDTGKLKGLQPQALRRIEERLTEEEKEAKPQSMKARGIGEINGMAIYSDGVRSMGIPVKIQALCRRKRGRSRSLEKNSGPIYRKGMEVLKEYWKLLSRKYSFTILMEGNYHYLEGDSATIAQLYAVLSAAGGWRPKEGVAVTGAMNLTGDVLPVGGVTEKAEGAFRSGGIGLIYPADNRRDLYLRPGVTRAVERGEFFLWPIRRIEEGAEILFGQKWETLIRKI